MTLRLGEYVVYGELRNTNNYSTHGIVVLRGKAPGEETVLRIDLTGNCDPDLEGKHFRFLPGEADDSDIHFVAEENTYVRDMQFGPTGIMTSQGWLRTLPCGVEEFLHRSKLGEPPPTPWKRRLFLEWYGPNGRTTIEMVGAVVEECIRQPEDDDDEGDWTPVPNLADPPDTADAEPAAGPEFTILRQDGDEVHIEHWTPPPGPERGEHGYESVPGDLQRTLDRESAAIDRAIRGEDGSGDDDTAELELMDYCLEHGETQSAASLLPDVGELPRPETLSDEEVEGQLKVLLAHLAFINVAFDVCEHFSPRDCYCLLVDTILKEKNTYAELIGTGWTQHFSTYDYCQDCDAEVEETMPDMEDEEC